MLVWLTLAVAAQTGCTRHEWPRPWRAPGEALTDAAIGGTLGFSDALSAPVIPTLDAAGFLGASACATCHRTHADEWRQSAHARAMHDRVFQGLVRLQRAQREDTEFDAYCVQCHSPIALRSGSITKAFEFENLSDLALEGVTCEVCHRAQHVERPYGSGLVITQDGLLRGPIADPRAPHPAEANPIFESSELCASCHDVRSVDGVKLETPYEEWLDSPAAADGRTCQSCHMPTYSGRTAPAYPGSPERRELHRHRFNALEPVAGSSCDDPGHLCSSARLEARLQASESDWQLEVRVQSLVDGHGFPTGSVFFRQAWVAVEVRGADGELVYQSGHLDENADLHDHHDEHSQREDPQLQVLHGYLLDADSTPTLLPWRAVRLQSNALKPGGSRAFSYHFQKRGVAWPLRALVRLRFRSFSPRLLRAIGESELVDDLETTDVAEITTTLERSASHQR